MADDPIRLLVTYSDHARQRMRRRNVSEAQVVATVHYPDNRRYQADSRAQVVRQTAIGAYLQVVYEEQLTSDGGIRAHVVTVMRGRR